MAERGYLKNTCYPRRMLICAICKRDGYTVNNVSTYRCKTCGNFMGCKKFGHKDLKNAKLRGKLTLLSCSHCRAIMTCATCKKKAGTGILVEYRNQKLYFERLGFGLQRMSPSWLHVERPYVIHLHNMFGVIRSGPNRLQIFRQLQIAWETHTNLQQLHECTENSCDATKKHT